MKKGIGVILSIVLIISIMLTGVFNISAGAESTVVNAYDAQTLETALTTVDADVVLWNDITYSSSAEILCHSLDLNGYTLVYNHTMRIASDVDEFVILDSLYSESAVNTGKLTVEGGVKIAQGDFIVENGRISIYVGVWGDGNFKILDGKIYAYGSDGRNGMAGEDGANATPDYYDGRPGKDGTDGYDGTDGAPGIDVTTLLVQDGYLYVSGGTGGEGGDGGDGGDGADGKDCTSNNEAWGNYDGGDGGNGGNGGDGGDGGDAGHGIIADTVEIFGGIVEAYGAAGGAGGEYGIGGRGGAGGDRYSYKGSNGIKGSNGQSGSTGSNGISSSGIFANTVIVYSGKLSCYGGKASFSGGAGVHGDLTVNGGEVYAYGKGNAAGIGGSGNSGITNGSNVTITGGYVFAQGNGNGFDIGGGYYNGVGTPGALEVTGGTLEFATYGRATNVSTPVFKNCTVTGAGAYQHEGTYNADGKFAVTADDISIDPADCVGYDTVTVTAAVHVSRTTNITTPKPKGYISFKLDGVEFATAALTDAVAADGVITATASAEWIAVEGEQRLTAEYVAGAGDAYASGGVYAETVDIAQHTHDWDEEYTVDVEPTCTVPGSKSIHCAICDVQKDFTEIDATGHDYVDNQCRNCEEFLPLIVFKDYDGRVLSSEYYYLGDTVTVPNAPSRAQDDTYTYAFVGWDQDVTACDGDKVYTAVYDAIYREYTIVFKNYDGSELQKRTYHYGDVVAAPSETPQKAADQRYEYVFAGWDTPIAACAGDKVYTAVFTAQFIDYTVTFKNDNGAVLSQQTYHYGDTVVIPAQPTKAADETYTYSFAGWDSTVTTVTGDVVYTAVYRASYIDYTVTFKDDNGTTLSQKTYHYGDAVVAPADPIKPADDAYTYTFAGWDKTVVSCVGDAVYTATYTRKSIAYTVVFKDWNGDLLSSRTYYWGDAVTAPDEPSKSADNTYTYTFDGWDKTVVKCAGDAVYTATYARRYIDYTVVFRNWDGTTLSSKTYHWGDRVTAPTAPTKAADDTYAYTFAGWDTSVVACAGDKVYTATYTRSYVEYTVTFKDWNGDRLSTATYYWGDKVIVPDAPVRAADNTYTYTFAGWDKAVANCAGDAVYTATYTREYIDYTVVFKNWDGTPLSTKTYHWGDTVTAPTAPTKAADATYTYTFAGWDTPVVACAGDKVYTAVFTAEFVEYTVTFKNDNGAVLSQQTYHYGDAVTAPIDPVRAADDTYTYTFAGWDKAVANCAGDAVYTATYTREYIDYTVVFKNWDGTPLSTQTYHWGDAVTAPDAPTKAADDTYTYTFAGWDKAVANCAGDVVYTATYMPVYIDYVIVFKNDDGTVVDTQTLHWGDTVTVPADPTKAEDDAYTYTFAGWDKDVLPVSGDAEYTATFTATIKKNGWVQESGKWAYYKNGAKLTSQWMADSVGWCYLGADGYMLTNEWVKDSVGWCYVGSDGYCVTNEWRKDSVGWCYLDSNGRMATNQWIKDSVGWCYVGADGYCVTNCWKQDSVGWCYLDANGRMATNCWVCDSVGWCYVGADGYAVTNCWKRDSVGWCYLNGNGSMTKNAWVLDGGKWYYCDSNGYMLASTSRNIGGETYHFNASGVCTNP